MRYIGLFNFFDPLQMLTTVNYILLYGTFRYLY